MDRSTKLSWLTTATRRGRRVSRRQGSGSRQSARSFPGHVQRRHPAAQQDRSDHFDDRVQFVCFRPVELHERPRNGDGRPRERSTAYLLHPDPDDPYFQQHPEQLRSELHGRLTMPLYGLAFVLLPLLFIGQADLPRESRAASITMLAILIMALGPSACSCQRLQ